MKAPDDATFEALNRAYLHRIPRMARNEEIAEARDFGAIIGKLGDAALLGPMTDLPDEFNVKPAIYR